MSSIMVFSENRSFARQLLTAALELKGKLNLPVNVLAVTDKDAEELALCGADKVTLIKSNTARPESLVPAFLKIAEEQKPAVFLFGASARGKDIAAKIAAGMNAGLVTEAQKVTAASGALETERLIYGGLAVCKETVAFPALATIAARAYDECATGAGKCETVTVDAEADAKVTVQSTGAIVTQGVDITEATRIVCVGRGMGKKEDLAMAEELAAALKAEIGCTRGIAEDYHWLPVERYIGISGKKVKPELYLTLGVSGQVQHVAGMRESGLIIAIDTNEKAPIFNAADYGIVGDMYEVVPLLISALK